MTFFFAHFLLPFSFASFQTFLYTGLLTIFSLIVGEERATWPKFTMDAGGKKYGRAAIFGSGNSEIAGGKEKGMAVKVEEDTWRRKECQYWDERTELFES
jgi:hypothetical protein